MTFILKRAVVTVYRGDGCVTICYLLDGQPGANGNFFLHLIMIKKQFSASTLVDEWQRKCLNL